jgi:hypothetical protein
LPFQNPGEPATGVTGGRPASIIISSNRLRFPTYCGLSMGLERGETSRAFFPGATAIIRTRSTLNLI